MSARQESAEPQIFRNDENNGSFNTVNSDSFKPETKGLVNVGSGCLDDYVNENKVMTNGEYITQGKIYSSSDGNDLEKIAQQGDGTKKKLISIMDYDPEKKVKFTEPETVLALKITGVDSRDLFMPTKEDLSKYPKDPEAIEIILQYSKERIERVASLVKEARASIINRHSNETSENTLVKLSNEKNRAVRRVTARHKKDIETLLTNYYRQEMLERERQAIEVADMERCKRLQEEKEKNFKELSRKHKDEGLNTKKLIDESKQKIEDEKRKEMYEKEMHICEKQKRFAEMKENRQKEMGRMRMEKMENIKSVLEKIEKERQDKRIKLSEELAEKAEKSEKRVADEKLAIQLKAKNEHDMKVRQSQERRKEIEKGNKEKINNLQNKLNENFRRVEDNMKERELRAQLAYTNDRTLSKSSTKFDLWQKENEQRQKMFDEQSKEEEFRAKKIKDEKEKERVLRQVVLRLKSEERERAAKRVSQQRSYQLQQLRNRIDDDEQRVTKYLLEKQKLNDEKRRIVEATSSQFSIMLHDFQDAKLTGRPVDVKAIADKYGIDLEEIKKKVAYKDKQPIIPQLSRQNSRHRPLTSASCTRIPILKSLIPPVTFSSNIPNRSSEGKEKTKNIGLDVVPETEAPEE